MAGIPHKEYRCKSCKKLFFKGLLIEGEVEVKCKYCHSLTTIHASNYNEFMCAIPRCPNRIRITPEE